MNYRFGTLDFLKDLEKPDFAKHSGNIVLWGAGKLGGVAAFVLEKKGIEFIAFCDNDSKKQGSIYHGRRVISPDALFADYKEAVVIITTVDHGKIKEQLSSNPVGSYFDAWPLYLDINFEGYSDFSVPYIYRMLDYYFHGLRYSMGVKQKYVTHRMRVIVTNKCTLRCKNCCIFTPYVKIRRDCDWMETIGSVGDVIDAVGYMNDLTIYGGEALLHPHLTEIIKNLRNEPRIGVINLATNGSITLGSSLIEALKNDSRTCVIISNYGPKLSPKRNEIISILVNHGIAYEEINYKTWYKASVIEDYRDSDDIVRNRFLRCTQLGGCGIVLWDGKIYLCQTIPFLIDLTIFPPSVDSCLDLKSIKHLSCEERRLEIYNYINRINTTDFIDACRYCSGLSSSNFMNMVSVAEQATGPMKMNQITV